MNSPQVWVPHPCFFLARVGGDGPGSKNREWKFSVLPKVPIGIQMKAQLRFMPTHPSKEKIEGWGTRHNRRILLPIPLFGFAASHPWLEKSQGCGTQVIDRLRVGHPAPGSSFTRDKVHPLPLVTPYVDTRNRWTPMDMVDTLDTLDTDPPPLPTPPPHFHGHFLALGALGSRLIANCVCPSAEKSRFHSGRSYHQRIAFPLCEPMSLIWLAQQRILEPSTGRSPIVRVAVLRRFHATKARFVAWPMDRE